MFKEKVYNIVKQIPPGKLLTYKQVATLAGSPQACQAVGQILSKNYNPQIPCHRVIKTNGQLGGYNRGLKAKINRLKEEGIDPNHGLNYLYNFNQIHGS